MSILSNKQIEWAYNKWCDGYTQMQIADALFVDKKTVSRSFKGRKRIRPVLKYDFEEEQLKENKKCN